MNANTFRTAMKEMAKAGRAMAEERGASTLYSTAFVFGEWAGESEREIIEGVTGVDYDDFTEDQLDALCDAFLDGDAGIFEDEPHRAGKHTGASKTVSPERKAGRV